MDKLRPEEYEYEVESPEAVGATLTGDNAWSEKAGRHKTIAEQMGEQEVEPYDRCLHVFDHSDKCNLCGATKRRPTA